MAQLQEFMQYVLPYTPGCTDPLAEQYIRDVCIDFCVGSSIAQFTVDPIDVQAGQVEYDIDTPTGSETSLILAASYNGVPLSIEKTGDSVFMGAALPIGTPNALMQAATNIFTLNSTPQFDAPGAIQMLVATKPTRTATSVADVLLEYAYEIGLGVVGRLLLIPGHEFSAPQLAAAYTATYSTAKFAARIRAERSFGAAPTRARPRAFG